MVGGEEESERGREKEARDKCGGGGVWEGVKGGVLASSELSLAVTLLQIFSECQAEFTVYNYPSEYTGNFETKLTLTQETEGGCLWMYMWLCSCVCVSQD